MVVSWEAEYGADAHDAVETPEGIMFTRPDGQLESWSDRQMRLAHNTKMRFHRTFASTLFGLIMTRG